MRRVLSSAVAVVSAVAALAVPASSSPSASDLTWGACPESDIVRDPRTRCATLRVPRDHRRPHGPQITVAISRIPTADPLLRRGILLSNPGGPGGSGLDFPQFLAEALPPEVLARYDLIGFDPRGVGASTPIGCGIPEDTPIEVIIPYPAPDGSIDHNVEFARATAAGCAASAGALLPHITTANTARDMDRVRAALDEDKLSYLGYSYGTYLGAVYASLFPHRGDRILLDSAVDPQRIWYDTGNFFRRSHVRRSTTIAPSRIWPTCGPTSTARSARRSARRSGCRRRWITTSPCCMPSPATTSRGQTR